MNFSYPDLFCIFGLSEVDAAKFTLILRYKDKVSDRLKAEAMQLKKKGEKNYRGILSEMLMQPNPLLDRIPKTESWGANIIVPLGKKDET